MPARRGGRSLLLELDHDPSAQIVARRAVLTLLGGADARVAHNALLAVSELVGNALLHAEDGCVLRAAWSGDDALRVEVTDTQPRLPRVPTAADAPEVGGHGLRVVEAVSRRWGVLLHDGGKTVWADLPTTV